MKTRYPVKNYMRQAVHTIGEDIELSTASAMMHEHRIRHLPVLNRGTLVGVLSDRDVKFALSIHPSASTLKVGDIMTDRAYSVSPEAPVENIVKEMAQNKYGCSVVTDSKGHVLGIFTAVDALNLLSEVMGETAQPVGLIA